MSYKPLDYTTPYYHSDHIGRVYDGTSLPGRGGGSFYRGRTGAFRSRLSGTNPPGRDILEGLVYKPLKVIRRCDTPAMPEIVLKDVQYLASYNWIESKEPTIIVPGSPRVWLNKPVPFKVSPDSGVSYVDQNGHRMPSTPLVPLFRAVDIMEKERDKPKLDWTAVDIVTDRNSLRKLLAFVEGNNDPFRIDLQLAGGWTVLFHRWEERSMDVCDSAGFGESFERAATAPAPGCEYGTLVGHHRIITYEFAGLKLVLRYEVDAYYPTDKKSIGSSKPPGMSKTQGAMTAKASDPLDDLTNAISGLSLKKSKTIVPEFIPNSGGLRVIRAGAEVPQSSLIKIKTRSARNIHSFNWGLFYPQQFIGQIPTQVIGVHQGGNFYEVREKKLDAPEFAAVKDKGQAGLKRLHQVLEEIHNFAMAHGKEARLSLVSRDGVLQVMQRQSADSFLPSDVLKRFEAA